MKGSYLTLVLLFVWFHTFSQNGNVTISGFVREKGSMESLPGVNVYLGNSGVGTVTNTYGFYSISVAKKDSLKISYSFVSYERADFQIPAMADYQLNVALSPFNQLEEVTVSACLYIIKNQRITPVQNPGIFL